MCAIEAGSRNRRVALLDHADRLGKKILISGGGRCNFTNLHTQPENFLSANPHFAKSALSRYTPADFIALVEKHRIPYHEKTLGQLFCDRSARDILAMLEEECRAANVTIFLNAKIREVTRTAEFVVRTTTHRIPRASTRRRHRRPVHSQDRRDLLRLRSGPPVRSKDSRPLARPRAPGSRTRRSLALLRSRRSLRRSGRLLRRPALPRKNADHPSRPERPSDPADFFVLEKAAADHTRPRSGK